jgi:hypothetical protein
LLFYCLKKTVLSFLLFCLDAKKVTKKVKANAIAPQALPANAHEHSD